jgi:DNA-binding HxlR family transcriptional regulator
MTRQAEPGTAAGRRAAAAPAPVRRRYEDACGAAHGLDLVGERWALLVMRELIFGPRRFGDLRAALAGISANVLTQRLEGLEAAGIVERRRLPPPASVQVYALTQWGAEAEPIFQALGRWAARSPAHDASLPLSPVSLMLSFRTLFDGARARGVALQAGFVFGAETFVASVRHGRLSVAREAVEGADVVFVGTAQTVAAAVHGKVPLPVLEQAGALEVTGDRAAAQRFIDLFDLPPKAVPTAK